MALNYLVLYKCTNPFATQAYFMQIKNHQLFLISCYKILKFLAYLLIMTKSTEAQETFNPDRGMLSILLDEYLNEVSPMTDNQISYEGTYKLVRKYFIGVTYRDIKRAVRYFSPTYMITFENYIEILKIFFKEQQNYRKKAEESITNVLLAIKNKDYDVTSSVEKIISSLRLKAEDESSFDHNTIICLIQKFINNPKEIQIDKILDVLIPPNQTFNTESPKDDSQIEAKDFKLYIHLLDLFNINKCIKFLEYFKKNNNGGKNYLPLKIGFSIECKLKDKSKFSRVAFINPFELNYNSNEDNNNSDEIYYRVNDRIILDFNINPDQFETNPKDSKNYYAHIMNSPLVFKLYAVIIPSKAKYHPMKFLYGYLKVPLVPILFSHGHEIRLSGNFIPLEKDFNPIQEKSKKDHNVDDQVMISFSVAADSDPYICYSKPYGLDISKIDGVEDPILTNLRNKTILSSKSRTCQISARDENFKIDLHHFLCFYINTNVVFKTDDLIEMLIQDARKPGKDYDECVRSPATLYYNQGLNFDLEEDENSNGIIRPLFPFMGNPEMISGVFHKFEENKENLMHSIKFSPKMTQLERCIFLCGSLIKDGHESFVCCGAVDLCDSYFVIELCKEDSSQSRYLHQIPGHVYPISLLPYSIHNKDKDANKIRLNRPEELKINNLQFFNFSSKNEHYKDYKYVRVICLSEVKNDLIPSSFHVTSIFNDKNIWINQQAFSTILRINWDISNTKYWFPVLQPPENGATNTVYSKRKVIFPESFDKVKYELCFDYELEQYFEEKDIQANPILREYLNYNKNRLFGINDENNNNADNNMNEDYKEIFNNYFFRRIEAPYFMMPDELLEYIIENNGLRYLQNFDIIIDFKPLPFKNCKIDIIIAYGTKFFVSFKEVNTKE